MSGLKLSEYVSGTTDVRRAKLQEYARRQEGRRVSLGPRLPGTCACGAGVVLELLPSAMWVDPLTDKPCTHGAGS